MWKGIRSIVNIKQATPTGRYSIPLNLVIIIVGIIIVPLCFIEACPYPLGHILTN